MALFGTHCSHSVRLMGLSCTFSAVVCCFSAVDADRVHVLHVAHVQCLSVSVTKNKFLSVYW